MTLAQHYTNIVQRIVFAAMIDTIYICITFMQCLTNVEDVGPTLYICYRNDVGPTLKQYWLDASCLLGCHCYQTNTRRWPNTDSLLHQRLWRWSNMKPALAQRLVFARWPLPWCAQIFVYIVYIAIFNWNEEILIEELVPVGPFFGELVQTIILTKSDCILC